MYGWLKVAFGIFCLGKTCGAIFCLAACFTFSFATHIVYSEPILIHAPKITPWTVEIDSISQPTLLSACFNICFMPAVILFSQHINLHLLSQGLYHTVQMFYAERHFLCIEPFLYPLRKRSKGRKGTKIALLNQQFQNRHFHTFSRMENARVIDLSHAKFSYICSEGGLISEIAKFRYTGNEGSEHLIGFHPNLFLYDKTDK